VANTPKSSKKRRLGELLAEWGLQAIAEPEWRRLAAELAPISESYLRRLLRETGLPVEQPFAGIRQSTFEDLEASLIAMERSYAQAREGGDRARAQYCRSQVIEAKDHARLAARSPSATAEKKLQKDEMIQWMLVWLENPAVFEEWVKLRKGRV
jgi:hypothetical protein